MFGTRSPLRNKQNKLAQNIQLENYKKQRTATLYSKNDKFFKRTNVNADENNETFNHQINIAHQTNSELLYQSDDLAQQHNERLKNMAGRLQANISSVSKGKYTEQRKYNIKQAQIECKINKIQNYQNKIQHLLDFIRTKTPLKSKQKYDSPLHKKSPQKNSQNRQAGKTPTQRNRSRLNLNESPKSCINNSNKKDKYIIGPHAKLKTQNQNDRIQKLNSNKKRQKSKEFMKSIEGQVNEIKNTVQLLNIQLQKNDNIKFRKQVNFDDLTTSNPQSTEQTLLENTKYVSPFNLNQNKYQQSYNRLNTKYQPNTLKNQPLSKFQEYKMRKHSIPSRQPHLQNPYQQNSKVPKQTGYIYKFQK